MEGKKDDTKIFTWFNTMVYVDNIDLIDNIFIIGDVYNIFLNDYNVLWGILFIHKTTNTTLQSNQYKIP